MPSVLDTLRERGFVSQVTDEKLGEQLEQKKFTVYAGFDPTADSLHLGHVVPIMALAHFQRAGHKVLLVVGGATGMIGDPKESGERTLNSLDTVKDWVEKVRRQLEPFLSFEGANSATMVNNYDWTASLSVIDFLRDIGKHFPVNRMLA